MIHKMVLDIGKKEKKRKKRERELLRFRFSRPLLLSLLIIPVVLLRSTQYSKPSKASAQQSIPAENPPTWARSVVAWAVKTRFTF